jgi:ribonucleotide monophosphatase NagD (HAD superfamily)
LTKAQMVSTSYSCARYLTQHLEVGSRVHLIGSTRLCEELESNGFRLTGGPSNDNDPASMNREELAKYDFDEHPIDALAVGCEPQFSFRKLAIASNLLLRNPSSLFVATNHDSFDLGM